MRVALVTSRYLPRCGGLERHVATLARGLAGRGVQVEVLTQAPLNGLPAVSEEDGFVVRRFGGALGHSRLAVAAGLWGHLHRSAASLDLVHTHSASAPFAYAVASAGPPRLVFTPHAPLQRLLRWPWTHLTARIVGHAAQTVCTSTVERQLLCRTFPWAEGRTRVVPNGVDAAEIRSAEPFLRSGTVVLAVGRLARCKRFDRAIAAMVSLESEFRLVVVGDGPIGPRLRAHTTDLHVSSRVEFTGGVPTSELYRWLRTARVLVALAEEDSSGLTVTEALSAGLPVVASDIPVHREAAASVAGAPVIFVSPEGSPLEVADAISEAARIQVPPALPTPVPSWEAVVDASLGLYEELASRKPAAGVARINGAPARRARSEPAGVGGGRR